MTATPSAPAVSIKEIDALLSGATPQFAMQLQARVYSLICELPEDDDVRRYGEVQMRMLDRLAMGTTRAPHGRAVPPADDPGWATIPSHPAGEV